MHLFEKNILYPLTFLLIARSTLSDIQWPSIHYNYYYYYMYYYYEYPQFWCYNEGLKSFREGEMGRFEQKPENELL